jgi:hypothetical protein
MFDSKYNQNGKLRRMYIPCATNAVAWGRAKKTSAPLGTPVLSLGFFDFACELILCSLQLLVVSKKMPGINRAFLRERGEDGGSILR